MAEAETSRTLSVDLPLSLSVKQEEGLLTEKCLRDIARELKVNLFLLGQHIRSNKDLQFVSIIDASFQNSLVHITLKITDEAQLNSLYTCLEKEDNELSSCISTYFAKESMEIVAGLELSTVITCKIGMSKSVFYKCSYQLSEIEEEFRKANEQKGDQAVVSKVDKGNDFFQEPGNVRQKVHGLTKLTDPTTWPLNKSTSTADTSYQKDSLPPYSTTRIPGSYPYESKDKPEKKLGNVQQKIKDFTKTTDAPLTRTLGKNTSTANTSRQPQDILPTKYMTSRPGGYPYESNKKKTDRGKKPEKDRRS